MPAATWASNRSSGPRTAATMQNSVAPDFAVCLAASTRLGMSSHALRTGDLQPLPFQEGDAKEAPIDLQRWENDLNFRFRAEDAGEVLEREGRP